MNKLAAIALALVAINAHAAQPINVYLGANTPESAWIDNEGSTISAQWIENNVGTYKSIASYTGVAFSDGIHWVGNESNQPLGRRLILVVRKTGSLNRLNVIEEQFAGTLSNDSDVTQLGSVNYGGPLDCKTKKAPITDYWTSYSGTQAHPSLINTDYVKRACSMATYMPQPKN